MKILVQVTLTTKVVLTETKGLILHFCDRKLNSLKTSTMRIRRQLVLMTKNRLRKSLETCEIPKTGSDYVS